MSCKVICSVFDSKAQAFLRPFFSESRLTAMRAFTDAVNDPSQIFYRHPDDFTLFELGTFNELEGSFELHEAKANLGLASQYLEAGEPAPSNMKAIK